MDKAGNFELVFKTLSERRSHIINALETKLLANNICPLQSITDFPVLIQSLADVFNNNGELNQDNEEEIHQLNKIHAVRRATQSNFSLNDLLKEFSLLRETIMEHLYTLATPELYSARIIHQFIDLCVQSTVLEFERLQNEKIFKHRDELEVEKILHQRFVAALTHDLRTPLTAAIISTEMMGRLKETTPQHLKHIGRNLINLRRIENMIEDFLDFALIKAGKSARIKASEFNLNSLIEETIENLTTIHGPRFVFHQKESLEVYVGRKSIQRILENLATNGIKYGSQSGMITISLSRKNDSFELEVHNEGSPIEIENPNLLFENFVRTEKAKRSDKIGWGLGLPLVKGLVDAHKGKIQVMSSVESGTSFVIQMPMKFED